MAGVGRSLGLDLEQSVKRRLELLPTLHSAEAAREAAICFSEGHMTARSADVPIQIFFRALHHRFIRTVCQDRPAPARGQNYLAAPGPQSQASGLADARVQAEADTGLRSNAAAPVGRSRTQLNVTFEWL